MAVLRKVAMIRGVWPVRTWERSSSKETSRTQCSLFSMAQWPWTQAARTGWWGVVVVGHTEGGDQVHDLDGLVSLGGDGATELGDLRGPDEPDPGRGRRPTGWCGSRGGHDW